MAEVLADSISERLEAEWWTLLLPLRLFISKGETMCFCSGVVGDINDSQKLPKKASLSSTKVEKPFGLEEKENGKSVFSFSSKSSVLNLKLFGIP